MTNTLKQKILAGVLVAGALLGALAWFGVTPFKTATSAKTQFGDIESNPPWFTNGFGFGTNKALYLSGTLALVSGQNQMAWQNNTGSTVTVDVSRFDLNGTASSTFAVWVGTSTTATVTNQFNTNTAPMWSQLISASNTIATGTIGTYPTQLDNFVNHKSGYPAEIQVLNGQYLLLVASSFCTADGACNTATSTARGWTALLPFLYHYGGLQ